MSQRVNSPVTTRTLMLVSVAAVTAVTLLSGCAPLVIGGAATAVMMAEDRRSSGVFVDDENIENRALLKVKTRYNNQVHVNITSYNRHVLISGEAASEAVKPWTASWHWSARAPAKHETSMATAKPGPRNARHTPHAIA